MRRVSSLGIGNLLLTNTKIILILILSREVTKIFVIANLNIINSKKKKKNTHRERKILFEDQYVWERKLLGNRFHLIPHYALLI